MLGITWAEGALFIGALAFVITVITELTKNLAFLAKFPTDLQVILLGIAGGVIALLAWGEENGQPLSFWLIGSGVLLGLLASFVAMYGWATFRDLLLRFCPAEKEEEE